MGNHAAKGKPSGFLFNFRVRPRNRAELRKRCDETYHRASEVHLTQESPCHSERVISRRAKLDGRYGTGVVAEFDHGPVHATVPPGVAHGMLDFAIPQRECEGIAGKSPAGIPWARKYSETIHPTNDGRRGLQASRAGEIGQVYTSDSDNFSA